MKGPNENLIRISAKTLGEVALPTFCPRCFWYKLRLGFKLPYQIFPGIFSSIDSFTKRVVESWFDKQGGPPRWVEDLGPIVGYRTPPHHSRYNVVEGEFGVLLTGTPDAIFTCKDRSFVIVDYKTARFTKTQDELLPMYRTQLNVYALIGQKQGIWPVNALALIYMEPKTELDDEIEDPHRAGGFIMPFEANVVPVAVDLVSLDLLMLRVRKIHDMDRPPEGAPGCKDCSLLDRLFEAAGHCAPRR
jgi:hypothetical protein